MARLPIANFYAVIFLAPTVASILAALFMREHLTIPGKTHKAIGAAGFTGVVIAINPAGAIGGMTTGDLSGYGIALLGMMVVSTQMLVLRRIGNREKTREATAFYPGIAAVPLAVSSPFFSRAFHAMPLEAVNICAFDRRCRRHRLDVHGSCL